MSIAEAGANDAINGTYTKNQFNVAIASIFGQDAGDAFDVGAAAVSLGWAMSGSPYLQPHAPAGAPPPAAAPPLRPATEQPMGGNGVVLRDGQGATSAEIAASQGGPTGGARVGQEAVRQRLLADARQAGNDLTCWRCGQTSTNRSDMHVGHRNVPTSQRGNLDPVNVCLEGAACNLSANNRGGPSPGMSCAERGSCGAPFGR
jgi:hypothetical protein